MHNCRRVLLGFLVLVLSSSAGLAQEPEPTPLSVLPARGGQTAAARPSPAPSPAHGGDRTDQGWLPKDVILLVAGLAALVALAERLTRRKRRQPHTDEHVRD